MEEIGLIAILLCILVAAAISRRIQGTMLTLPMVYTLLGLLLGYRALDIIQLTPDNEIVQIIAELTLVLVLASDASRINLRALVKDHLLPLRLLGIGLPLTMIFGTVLAFVMFDILTFWEAVIVAVILAPTDASLGQSVVTNPKVPVRIRQTLNIESGLNDGIAMPFLLLAIFLAVAEEMLTLTGEWIFFSAGQIVFGVIVGVVVGYLGIKFIERGYKTGWMTPEFQKISALALALLAYAVAEPLGGNGLIAAFCMGATIGNVSKTTEAEVLHEHIEVEVQLLMLLTFIIFGAVLLPPILDEITGMTVIYAILSLVLVRPLAVAISLTGSKVRPVTTLFLGWFGPRGIASILYIFIVIETGALAGHQLINNIVMVTVFLSIFAHGITAAPAAKYYGQRMADEDIVQPDAIEKTPVMEMPLRTYPKT